MIPFHLKMLYDMGKPPQYPDDAQPTPSFAQGITTFLRTSSASAMCVFTTFLLAFLGLTAVAQPLWVKSQGGANVDETLAVTSDNAGAVYMTGYFSTSAQINGVPLSVAGLTDIFVSKVNASGNTSWSVRAGGSGSDRGLDVAVDNSGNVYVSGFFSGTAQFGNGVSLTASGSSQDAYVVKYNGLGEAIWARAGGSPNGADRANSVAVDNAGNVFISGQFSGEADFDGIAVSGTGGTGDMFVAKYDSNGSILWAKYAQSSAQNSGMAIATDNNGAVFVAGQFSGDITFENSYSNTMLNAVFLVKYGSDGSESWVRLAGGGNQSMVYGLVSDGSNVYMTGDCGATLTFFGETTNPQITSTYSNAVYVAAYGSAGNYLWGASQSSTSPVSSRGIDLRGEEIVVGGWYECTFSTLSEHFGEAYFNSIGFRDAYVMRFTTSGAFSNARNFGSRNEEQVADVALPPDGKEVAVGKFTNHMIIPKSGAVSGLINVSGGPNQNTTYCGDANYGNFGRLQGAGNVDGFAVKAIDYDRSPYDYYVRFPGDCDTDIPTACIVAGPPFSVSQCEDHIVGCPPFAISAVIHTANTVGYNPSEVGFDYTVTWNPPGINGIYGYASTEGTYTATFTSEDGCYVRTAEVEVELSDPPPTPLMSDNLGFNDENLQTIEIEICPGETVDLWGTYTDEYDFSWTGPNLDPDQVGQEVITVDQTGTYTLALTNEEGCTSFNTIQVYVFPTPPEPIQPYYQFGGAVNDTVRLCLGVAMSVTVMDSLTMSQVPSPLYSWDWSVSPNYGFNGGSSVAYTNPPANGWYTFYTEITFPENECFDEQVYFVSDSVYVEKLPLPEVSVDISGPSMVCSGDTVTLYVEYSGNLSFNFIPIENFGDSLWVAGSGVYTAVADTTDPETGCTKSVSDFVIISAATTPEIETIPESAVICPGDSVALSTSAVGEIFWQGPDGGFFGDQVIYVSNSGLYFAEVEFYPGCALVSNTVQVSEYNTPFLMGSDEFLCPGDTVVLSVVTTDIDELVWLPPLSGSAEEQLITEPGIYSAEVTSCGITTQISMEVILSLDSLQIHRPDPTPKCEGDSILVVADPGFTDYFWFQTGETSDSIYVHGNTQIQAAAESAGGCHVQSNVLNIEFETTPPPPTFFFDRVCEGLEFHFTVQSSPYSTYFVDGPGGDTLLFGQEMVVPALDSDTSFYVFLSSALCTGPIDSALVSPKPYPPKPIPFSDGPVCTGTYLNLLVLNDSADVTYTWTSPTGITLGGADVLHFVSTMASAGEYSVFADLDGCVSDTARILVDLFETKSVQLPPDTIVCEQDGFVVSPSDAFAEYMWQDGATDSIYTITEPGEYSVLTTDFNGCKSFAAILVEMRDCELFIPNIITINDDGLNDRWWIKIDDPRWFEVTVYNRWGRMVYSSLDHMEMWDGVNIYSGEPCSEGVYFYIVKLRNYESEYSEHHGTLTLIRE